MNMPEAAHISLSLRAASVWLRHLASGLRHRRLDVIWYMWYVKCYMVCVICYMLYIICYMLYLILSIVNTISYNNMWSYIMLLYYIVSQDFISYNIFAICSMYDICYMLHAICLMQNAICCMLMVFNNKWKSLEKTNRWACHVPWSP